MGEKKEDLELREERLAWTIWKMNERNAET